MFGLSFYPFWDGTNENMQNAAKLIEDKYGNVHSGSRAAGTIKKGK